VKIKERVKLFILNKNKLDDKWLQCMSQVAELHIFKGVKKWKMYMILGYVITVGKMAVTSVRW